MTLPTNPENGGQQTKPQGEVANEMMVKEEKTNFRPYGMPGDWTKVTVRVSDPLEGQAAADATQPVDRWTARSFQDAMQGPQGKPPWIVEDLLLAESATLVSARPHAMKSLSWLSACLEAVTKKTVWGHFAAPDVDSVLFLETEDPTWMVESRIRGLAKGLGIGKDEKVPGFHYACVGPFDFLGKENRIEELVQMHAPDFIVLSTFQNLLQGRDYNRQNEMQPIMARMIRLPSLRPTSGAASSSQTQRR